MCARSRTFTANPSGQPQRVSITDSFGASPCHRPWITPQGATPAERQSDYNTTTQSKAVNYQRDTPTLQKLHVGKVKQITSSATLYGRF